MLGHVNNVRYLTYFEIVRTEYLYDFSKRLNVDGLAVILARSEIDYKLPAKWRDELVVKMRPITIGNSSWVYEYEVLREKDMVVVAVGKSVQVAYDYEKKATIPIPTKIKEAIMKEIEETKD